ncbi:TGS domain-containing protein [Escherichia coli]
MADSGEMLDEVRSQVFDDRVYVFTPKGDVVDLPAGSTPLDFAYHIHSDVGHRCIGKNWRAHCAVHLPAADGRPD